MAYRLRNRLSLKICAPLILSIILTVWAGIFGITVNQSLAIAFSLSILTLWRMDKFAGAVAGLIFFITKSFWVRAAYSLDYHMMGDGGFDLMGIAPALLLSGLIIFEMSWRFAKGERLCPDKTRGFMLVMAVISFSSIFNPASSPLIGLAGFERNVIPNMLIMFLLASIIDNEKQVIILVKTFLVLGILSTVYAIGQYLVALYPWEIDWYRHIAMSSGLTGHLTIGLRGIEFRVFSFFYGYMDFFFTNVIIFALALTHGDIFRGNWAKLRVLYFITWILILGLSLERMPFVMVLLVMMTLHFLKSSTEKRRRIIWRSCLVAGVIYGSLQLAGPYLKSSGAEKLIRLAELANPFQAISITDRAENKWGPAIETIKANPLGVGIGYGSQTKASEIAAKSEFFVQPHNELIQKTLETGFLGGIIYLLLIVNMYRDFLRLGREDNAGRAFGFAMVSITVAFLACGLVNLPFSGTPGLVFWALLGTALSLKDMSVSNRNRAKSPNLLTDINVGRMLQVETQASCGKIG